MNCNTFSNANKERIIQFIFTRSESRFNAVQSQSRDANVLRLANRRNIRFGLFEQFLKYTIGISSSDYIPIRAKIQNFRATIHNFQ